MTLMGYAQDYPKLKPLKEDNLEGKLIPYERKGKYGYKNLEGRVVIRAIFDKAEPFDSIVYTKREVKTTHKKIKVEKTKETEETEKAEKKDTIIARVKCGEKWGLIDRSGLWYITPRYKYLSEFNKEVAVFENEEGFGLLSYKKTHITEGFQQIEPFDSMDHTWMMRNDAWGVINKSGKVLINPILVDNKPTHLCGPFYEIKRMGKIGIINFSYPQLIIGVEYDEICPLNDMLLKCRKGADISIVTHDGCFVVEKYLYLQQIGASQWKYKIEGGWGIFDESGQSILQPIYDFIEYTHFDGTPVYILAKDGVYGLVDLNGERIVPMILETNQFENADSKSYFECWYEGRPYRIARDGKAYECYLTMSSLDCTGVDCKQPKLKFLEKYLSENEHSFYAEINRDKEFIYKDGFDEYSWTRKVAELIAPNSEGKIVPVGLWLDKILKTLNVEKMAEYYCREFQYGLSQAYAALEQTHIEIHLVQNEALGDGKSLVVADLSVSGHHIQRFVSVLNEAGTAIGSTRFDGRVYDRTHGVEVNGMKITRIDNNIVFNYCCFSDDTVHCDVYTEDLKLQFRASDISIKQIASVNDAYYFTGTPNSSNADVLYKVNKDNSTLIELDDNFSGVLTGYQDFVFIQDSSLSKDGDEVHRFFTCGKEAEIISAVAFNTFEWDGSKVIMKSTIDGRVRRINYDSDTSIAGFKIYLTKPDVFGLSVYKWQRSGGRPVVRYGLWSEDENCFTLPLFETLEVEGGEVKYTISGKGYKLGIREFLKQYKAAVKLTCAFDERGKVVSQVSDYSDLLGLEEEVVEEEAIPFQLVETKPSFNGGDANTFSKWVNERLVYPETAKENGVQGRVTLQFTVGKDGSVTNVKVLRGVDPSLDKEAVRVVSMSPKWKPGKQRDRAVPVTYTFPVIFQLR